MKPLTYQQVKDMYPGAWKLLAPLKKKGWVDDNPPEEKDPEPST